MEDQALYDEFRTEARDHLARVSEGLVRLERLEGNARVEEVNRLFRALHSIKGGAGFLGLKALESVSHGAETVLDRIRQGTLAVTPSLIDLLLEVNDRLSRLVEQVETSDTEDVGPLVDRLAKAAAGETAPATMVAEATLQPPKPPDSGTMEQAPQDPERGRTIRIPVEVADRLMNLASELVLIRNQALKKFEPRNAFERELVQRLNAVTSEIQRSVTSTRMQPVGALFQRFPRVARDIARQLGKAIDMVVSGTEVELDKGVIERLADPLTHLIRNACDHGIEPPAERLKAGKPANGTIRLEAHHEGSQIHVVVRDDGRGIDPERVARKAMERGLATRDELGAMSTSQLQLLVLKPGFSTAEKVTDLSGRGVGLDVVQANLAAIGGNLQIVSTPGQGTEFHLRLPLTLAIIPCLVVEAGGSRLCIPQRDLEELVLLDEGGRCRVETSHDRQVFRFRDQLIPALSLAHLLGEPAGDGDGDRFLAVVRAGAGRLGLVLDSIKNPEEIVVKPLHPALEGLGVFAGATVLGDGVVSLILDMEGISRKAGATQVVQATPTIAPPKAAEGGLVLVFEDTAGGRYGAPLETIQRVARFEAGQVQQVGGRSSLVLPDGIRAMLGLGEFLPGVPGSTNQESGYLLVPKDAIGARAGLVVADIVDTARAPAALQPAPLSAPGVLGAAELMDRLTLVVDPVALAAAWEGGS